MLEAPVAVPVEKNHFGEDVSHAFKGKWIDGKLMQDELVALCGFVSKDKIELQPEPYRESCPICLALFKNL